jgi:predicted RNase H-like nuclease (RuvC/YqgF family)
MTEDCYSEKEFMEDMIAANPMLREKLESLQLACQEKDKQIADQDIRIKHIEELSERRRIIGSDAMQAIDRLNHTIYEKDARIKELEGKIESQKTDYILMNMRYEQYIGGPEDDVKLLKEKFAEQAALIQKLEEAYFQEYSWYKVLESREYGDGSIGEEEGNILAREALEKIKGNL